METFTFRISEPLAARLSSAGMRTWLGDFLRRPCQLPADPGPGEARMSLTLPEALVQAVAACLHCSASTALRRVALGATQPPVAVLSAQAELEARHGVRDSSDSAVRTKDQRGGSDLASIKVKGIPGTIVSGVITLLAVVIWIFVITRKGKSTNANMTT
jgi:hypothetical protein